MQKQIEHYQSQSYNVVSYLPNCYYRGAETLLTKPLLLNVTPFQRNKHNETENLPIVLDIIFGYI